MKVKFNGISSKRTHLSGTSHFLPPLLQLNIYNDFTTITKETLRRIRTTVVAVENNKYFIF